VAAVVTDQFALKSFESTGEGAHFTLGIEPSGWRRSPSNDVARQFLKLRLSQMGCAPATAICRVNVYSR